MGFWGPFKPWLYVLKQAQNRKTHFETVSLPVAKILSPVARQAPTKYKRGFYTKNAWKEIPQFEMHRAQEWPVPRSSETQRALRDVLMPRGKNWLPTVSRQFLTHNYPRPNCLLKCLPNCLSPTREGFFFFFQSCPRGEGNCETTERQKFSRGNCFASRHQDASPGPLGKCL